MEPELIDVDTQLVAIERKTIAVEEIPAWFGRAIGAVAAAVIEAGGSMTGPPFGWYHGMPTDTLDVAAGFPVEGLATGTLRDGISVVERPGGRAAVTVHVGPYDTLAETHGELAANLAGRGLVPRGEVWEEYLTDPSTQSDPTTWQTRIVQPLV